MTEEMKETMPQMEGDSGGQAENQAAQASAEQREEGAAETVSVAIANDTAAQNAQTKGDTKPSSIFSAAKIPVIPGTGIPLSRAVGGDRAMARKHQAEAMTAEGYPAEKAASENQASGTAQPSFGAAPNDAAIRHARAMIEGELQEIRMLDPSVRTVADLTKTEHYDKLYALCKRGYRLSDAYKIANFDAVRAQAALENPPAAREW